jgi:hypothetical protein
MIPVGSHQTSSAGVTTFSGGSTFAYVTVTDRTVGLVVSPDAAAGQALVGSLRTAGVIP